MLYNKFGMAKVSSRWIPKLFTPKQKHTRKVGSDYQKEIYKVMETTFWDIDIGNKVYVKRVYS